ncbi:alpha/beta hydrolase [Acinetobacter sp. WCHAc060033]|uniref:alpha/beta hydrolase n=1 Tax=Acinetobacter sp. WCHAc060033 TaxID=2518624 RepID=UPI001022EB25|nr:alpha/beta hydrolase [Acinetobacter sp. WCHAc060033]RZG84523.1 alpha/beta hydrolase [Acinetobacter sp. WCHAc060033]
MPIKRFIVSILVFLQSFISAHAAKEQSYAEQKAWKELQDRMPENYRLTQDQLPQEYFWQWKENQVHVDYYPRPNSPAKVILLHGVGTNGRQMSLVLGHPLAQAGYETMSLDLIGYGLSQYPKKSKIRYEDWVQLVSDFVDTEAEKDSRPIFLYGLSAGGMLTLHVAMQNKNVKGIIGMTFLDQRNLAVKKGTMRFSPLSSMTLPSMKLSAKTPIGNIALPMSLVSKMYALSNDKEALKIMLNDKTSAGNTMSIKFLNSYMNYRPKYEISNFTQCPVLLTQPAEDHWTPLELSQPVLKQLSVPHQVVMLPKGGHYPVEAEALEQLKKSSIEFIQQNLKN